MTPCQKIQTHFWYTKHDKLLKPLCKKTWAAVKTNKLSFYNLHVNSIKIKDTNLSQRRIVQLPIIQSETSTTMRQVPGHMVINVLRTKRVLKLMRFNAPILREEASVKSLL